MNIVIVRTKLQAIIVRRMVDTGLIRGDLHLIQFYEDAGDASRHDLHHQALGLESVTSKTTLLSRSGSGTLGLFLYFLYLLYRSRIRGDRVYFANINWFPFALALKFCRGQRIFTFDDGSANIQQRNTSYLSQASSERPGPAGWFARRIFPNGCAAFVRDQIERHCTIYPGLANIVPDSKIDIVQIDWEELVNAADRRDLPEDVRRIFLGSVYSELLRPSGAVTENEVKEMLQWADLYIPHPRDATARSRPDVFVKYPAESIISHYAKSGHLIVAHYNSSAALPFRNIPNIRLVDLMETPIAAVRENLGQ
jgi:hypothetical protein